MHENNSGNGDNPFYRTADAVLDRCRRLGGKAVGFVHLEEDMFLEIRGLI